MNPQLIQLLADARQQDLLRQAHQARRATETSRPARPRTIARLATVLIRTQHPAPATQETALRPARKFRIA